MIIIRICKGNPGYGISDSDPHFAIPKYKTEEFIKKSILVFENKYDYSKVNYIGCRDKVIIIYKEHGEFKQTPYIHLQGHGCFKCMIDSHTGNKENFIEQSKKAHGDRYDYSKVNYIHGQSKVIIICKKHGEFLQTPNAHIYNAGCPICNNSKGELKIKNILENNKIKFIPQYFFKELKYINLLKFDFGIINSDGNLKCLIEFNGKQHYEYVKYFHRNKKNFKISQHKDKLKTNHCNSIDIPLFIIRYDENVEERMSEIIDQIFQYSF